MIFFKETVFPLIRRTGILMLLTLPACYCQAPLRQPQVEMEITDMVEVPFLQETPNTIENEGYLKPFFQKLYEQRVFGGRKINIVHLGDSHILGNFLTRAVRERLQKSFGDAGRGLIFPYKLAGTNGPTDYLVETNCKWKSNSCLKDRSASCAIGISGFSLETANNAGDLTIRLRDTASSVTRQFTKITIFHDNPEGKVDLEVKDPETGANLIPLIEGTRFSSFYLDKPAGAVSIKTPKNGSDAQKLRLDGISLENELAGVIYHSIGVNGARASDFLRASELSKGIGDLFPDLIILSFGTNEAQDGDLSAREFGRQLESLIKKLEEDCPGVQFLVTTPADSYLHGKGLNPNMPVISNAIREVAHKSGIACWDLFQISGGANSAVNWKQNGLMSSDSVHYSKMGYEYQGRLLYQSIINGYNHFLPIGK